MSSPARLISEIQSPRLKIRKVLLDCGAVQADALTVDRHASLEKYVETTVVPRAEILKTEVEWLHSIKTDFVVSDVVSVACRAAADAGIRSVCVTNFRFIYRETLLHTQDLGASIAMVRSMKECGSPIADEMMGDIKSSLGVILNSRSPWSRSGSATTATTTRGDSSSYFTTVFKSAKEKASNIKWPQLDFKVESSPNVEEEEEEEVLSKGEHMVEIGECNVCGV